MHAAEEVTHGEVGKLETYLAYDTSLSPAEGELYLVARLGCESELYVDGAIDGVGLWHGVHLFWVEVSHLGYLLHGHLEGIHAEKVAWLEVELAAHYFFIDACVSVDLYLVDGGLYAFADAHFEVNGVAYDVALYVHHIVKDVALIVVECADRLLLALAFESLVDEDSVVDIAFLHLKDAVEVFGAEDGVAYPVDAADVIFLAFVDVDVYVNKVVAEVYNTVAVDVGITVAEFVVLLDDALFVFFIFFLDELLCLEEALEAFFIGLLQEAA